MTNLAMRALVVLAVAETHSVGSTARIFILTLAVVSVIWVISLANFLVVVRRLGDVARVVMSKHRWRWRLRSQFLARKKLWLLIRMWPVIVVVAMVPSRATSKKLVLPVMVVARRFVRSTRCLVLSSRLRPAILVVETAKLRIKNAINAVVEV